MDAVFRHRLQRHPVAGNLQRPVPRRLAARRRRRWPALAGLSDGPDARPARRAGQSRAANPAARKCLGIEFLEFATDDRTATGLAKLFAGLGFRKVGAHKSKAVAHWSQGAIHLVLNSDKEGFAHSHQLSHGPSVCAICLKVDDATATLDRAEKLRDTPFRQAVGPGELEIRRCAASAASLLYFVDPKSELGRLWDIDFTAPRTPEGNGGAGLTAIDHVSQSMQYEEMLSWLLFYNSLLDVTKTPQLDVIDPGGIVRSQVVQTADGTLRIALNGLAEPADPGVEIPDALCRVRRAAHRFRHRRHRRHRQESSAPTASICCRCRRTITTISKRAPISPPTDSRSCAANNILYDRDEFRRISPGLHPCLRGSVLLRGSSSAVPTRASAPSMRRSGWPRKRGKCIVASVVVQKFPPLSPRVRRGNF